MAGVRVPLGLKLSFPEAGTFPQCWPFCMPMPQAPPIFSKAQFSPRSGGAGAVIDYRYGEAYIATGEPEDASHE